MATPKLYVGKQFTRDVGHASDAHYVTSMQATMREVTGKLLNILDQFEDASADLMKEAIEPTMDLADYYCPVLTGELQASRFIEVRKFRGVPRLEAGYAKGGKPSYAALVHEATWIPRKTPKRSKFLQAAISEDMNNIFSRLSSGYAQFMAGG